MKKTIKALGFSIEDTGETWLLKVPSWRFDMEQSADIVEEIARLEGYDALPTLSLPAPQGGKRVVTTPIQHRIRTARRTLAARGFLETMRARRTVRDFSDRPVPREVIEDCLLAAGTAPNGANRQPWKFVVVGDDDKLPSAVARGSQTRGGKSNDEL